MHRPHRPGTPGALGGRGQRARPGPAQHRADHGPRLRAARAGQRGEAADPRQAGKRAGPARRTRRRGTGRRRRRFHPAGAGRCAGARRDRAVVPAAGGIRQRQGDRGRGARALGTPRWQRGAPAPVHFGAGARRPGQQAHRPHARRGLRLEAALGPWRRAAEAVGERVGGVAGGSVGGRSLPGDRGELRRGAGGRDPGNHRKLGDVRCRARAGPAGAACA